MCQSFSNMWLVPKELSSNQKTDPLIFIAITDPIKRHLAMLWEIGSFISLTYFYVP